MLLLTWTLWVKICTRTSLSSCNSLEIISLSRHLMARTSTEWMRLCQDGVARPPLANVEEVDAGLIPPRERFILPWNESNMSLSISSNRTRLLKFFVYPGVDKRFIVTWNKSNVS